MIQERHYSIGEVAKRLQMSPQTIRRWERRMKFPIAKRNKLNNRREYTEQDIQEMLRILGRIP